MPERIDKEAVQKASPEVKRTIPFEVEIYTVPQSSPKEGTPSVRRPLSPDGSDQSIVIKRKRFGERYHACQSISPIVLLHDISYFPLSHMSKSSVQNESMKNVGGTVTKASTLEDQVPVVTQSSNSIQGSPPTEPSGSEAKNLTYQVAKPQVFRHGLPFNIYHDSDGTEPSGPEAKDSTSQVTKPPVYRDGLPFNIYHDSDGIEPSGPEARERLLHEAEILDPSAEDNELELILNSSQAELSSERMEVESSLESLPAKVIMK